MVRPVRNTAMCITIPTHRRALRWSLGCLWVILLAVQGSVVVAQDLDKTYSFDIQSRSLASALNEIATQTGHQLLFSHELVGSRDIQPLTGKYTLMQALNLMLDGTGLAARLTERGVILVKPASRDNNREEDDMKGKKNILAALIGAMVGTVNAQPVDGPRDPIDTGIKTLEEVVITAEKRSSNVQDIPISMTVLTGDQLINKSVLRLDDLQFASPGLSITDAGLTQSVNIRGIGLASGSPSVVNGVATYIDGLFQPPIVSTLGFFDLGDVQVFRGPQGTFAGANSTGGAVFINSRRPEIGGELNGYVQAGVGNYSARNGQIGIGIPLTDTLALRAAINYRDRDSFYKDIGPADTDAGRLDEISGRLGVTWRPIDPLEFYFKYERSEKETGGYAYRPIPTTAFSAGRTDDIRRLSYNSPAGNDEDAEVFLLESSYYFDSGVSLKLINGYQEREVNNLLDTDGTSIASNARSHFVRAEQESHEINLISPDDAQFRWVVGYYYQDTQPSVDIQNIPGVSILIGTTKKVKGIFGQVGYTFAEDFDLEFGLRKAWSESYGDPASGVFLPNGVKVATIAGDYEDDALLGKLSLNWSVDQNNLLYASVAKGYKPGGFNSNISTFESEGVWSYEAGWKSILLGGTVQTSLAFFYTDYEDFQNGAIDLSTGRFDVFNIAEATIKGAEFSVEAQLGAWRVDAAMSYVDSELSPTAAIVNTRELPGSNLGPQCPPNVASNPPTCFDYTPFLAGSQGGPNLFAPELSYTVGIEYEFEIMEGAYLTPRLNYGWIDDRWTNLLYEENTDLLKSRGLLSAMVTLEAGKWNLQLYGRNLADKEYITGQEVNFNVEFYGPPREYGVNLSYQF